MKTVDKIGEFSSGIAEVLSMNIPAGTEILLSESTLAHIKNNHPEITGDHKSIIADIINAPMGVSKREKDSSIGFLRNMKMAHGTVLNSP